MVNDPVVIGDINTLFFDPTDNFTGDTFEYAARDPLGGNDPTPAEVRLNPVGTNEAPDTEDRRYGILPNTTVPLDTLIGSDPEDGTPRGYIIDALPDPNDGVLFLGDPTNPANRIVPGQEIRRRNWHCNVCLDGGF